MPPWPGPSRARLLSGLLALQLALGQPLTGIPGPGRIPASLADFLRAENAERAGLTRDLNRSLTGLEEPGITLNGQVQWRAVERLLPRLAQRTRSAQRSLERFGRGHDVRSTPAAAQLLRVYRTQLSILKALGAMDWVIYPAAGADGGLPAEAAQAVLAIQPVPRAEAQQEVRIHYGTEIGWLDPKATPPVNELLRRIEWVDAQLGSVTAANAIGRFIADARGRRAPVTLFLKGYDWVSDGPKIFEQQIHPRLAEGDFVVVFGRAPALVGRLRALGYVDRLQQRDVPTSIRRVLGEVNETLLPAWESHSPLRSAAGRWVYWGEPFVVFQKPPSSSQARVRPAAGLEEPRAAGEPAQPVPAVPGTVPVPPAHRAASPAELEAIPETLAGDAAAYRRITADPSWRWAEMTFGGLVGGAPPLTVAGWPHRDGRALALVPRQWVAVKESLTDLEGLATFGCSGCVAVAGYTRTPTGLRGLVAHVSSERLVGNRYEVLSPLIPLLMERASGPGYLVIFGKHGLHWPLPATVAWLRQQYPRVNIELESFDPEDVGRDGGLVLTSAGIGLYETAGAHGSRLVKFLPLEKRLSPPARPAAGLEEPRAAGEPTQPNPRVPGAASHGAGAAPLWGENRRPSFPMTPEEVIVYYKGVGESLRNDVKDSMWANLPLELKDAVVLSDMPDQQSGIALLTTNHNLQMLARSPQRTPALVTYDAMVKRPVSESQLEQIKRGKAVVPSGRRSSTAGRVFIRPHHAEILRSASSESVIRVVVPESLGRQAGLLLDEAGLPPEQMTKVRVGAIALNGMRPGDYRRVTWDELVELMTVFGMDPDTIRRMSAEHREAVQEETEDRYIVMALLRDERFVRDIFRSVFGRSDLGLQDIVARDIQHIGEGGFKRVYQVLLRVVPGAAQRDDEDPSDFLAVVKVVKPDVTRSDSGYRYDERYVSTIAEVIQRVRQKFLFLHPASTAYYFPQDRQGRRRIVSAEGLVPPTNAALDDTTRDRLMIKTYLMLYLASGGKVFVADPKRPNVILRRRGRGRYDGTIIDLDNLIYGTVSDSDLVFHLLRYGFQAGDIIPVSMETLGTVRAQQVISSALFMGNYLLTTGEKEGLQQAYAAYQSEPHPAFDRGLEIPTAIPITVNGVEYLVPANVTLAEILDDRYADPLTMAVRVNGQDVTSVGTQQLSPREKRRLLEIPLSAGSQLEFMPLSTPTTRPVAPPADRVRYADLSRQPLVEALEQAGLHARLRNLKRDLVTVGNRMALSARQDDARLGSFKRTLHRVIHDVEQYLNAPLAADMSEILSAERIEAIYRTAQRVDLPPWTDLRSQLLDRIHGLCEEGGAIAQEVRAVTVRLASSTPPAGSIAREGQAPHGALTRISEDEEEPQEGDRAGLEEPVAQHAASKPSAGFQRLVSWAVGARSFLGMAGPPTIFLDIGTGSGGLATALARQHPRARVITLDPVERLESALPDNATFVPARIEQWKARRFVGRVDQIYWFFPDSLGPAESWEAVGAKLAALLKPGGRLTMISEDGHESSASLSAFQRGLRVSGLRIEELPNLPFLELPSYEPLIAESSFYQTAAFASKTMRSQPCIILRAEKPAALRAGLEEETGELAQRVPEEPGTKSKSARPTGFELDPHRDRKAIVARNIEYLRPKGLWSEALRSVGEPCFLLEDDKLPAFLDKVFLRQAMDNAFLKAFPAILTGTYVAADSKEAILAAAKAEAHQQIRDNILALAHLLQSVYWSAHGLDKQSRHAFEQARQSAQGVGPLGLFGNVTASDRYFRLAETVYFDTDPVKAEFLFRLGLRQFDGASANRYDLADIAPRIAFLRKSVNRATALEALGELLAIRNAAFSDWARRRASAGDAQGQALQAHYARTKQETLAASATVTRPGTAVVLGAGSFVVLPLAELLRERLPDSQWKYRKIMLIELGEGLSQRALRRLMERGEITTEEAARVDVVSADATLLLKGVAAQVDAMMDRARRSPDARRFPSEAIGQLFENLADPNRLAQYVLPVEERPLKTGEVNFVVFAMALQDFAGSIKDYVAMWATAFRNETVTPAWRHWHSEAMVRNVATVIFDDLAQALAPHGVVFFGDATGIRDPKDGAGSAEDFYGAQGLPMLIPERLPFEVVHQIQWSRPLNQENSTSHFIVEGLTLRKTTGPPARRAGLEEEATVGAPTQRVPLEPGTGSAPSSQARVRPAAGLEEPRAAGEPAQPVPAVPGTVPVLDENSRRAFGGLEEPELPAGNSERAALSRSRLGSNDTLTPEQALVVLIEEFLLGNRMVREEWLRSAEPKPTDDQVAFTRRIVKTLLKPYLVRLESESAAWPPSTLREKAEALLDTTGHQYLSGGMGPWGLLVDRAFMLRQGQRILNRAIHRGDDAKRREIEAALRGHAQDLWLLLRYAELQSNYDPARQRERNRLQQMALALPPPAPRAGAKERMEDRRARALFPTPWWSGRVITDDDIEAERAVFVMLKPESFRLINDTDARRIAAAANDVITGTETLNGGHGVTVGGVLGTVCTVEALTRQTYAEVALQILTAEPAMGYQVVFRGGAAPLPDPRRFYAPALEDRPGVLKMVVEYFAPPGERPRLVVPAVLWREAGDAKGLLRDRVLGGWKGDQPGTLRALLGVELAQAAPGERLAKNHLHVTDSVENMTREMREAIPEAWLARIWPTGAPAMGAVERAAGLEEGGPSARTVARVAAAAAAAVREVKNRGRLKSVPLVLVDSAAMTQPVLTRLIAALQGSEQFQPYLIVYDTSQPHEAWTAALARALRAVSVPVTGVVVAGAGENARLAVGVVHEVMNPPPLITPLKGGLTAWGLLHTLGVPVRVANRLASELAAGLEAREAIGSGA